MNRIKLTGGICCRFFAYIKTKMPKICNESDNTNENVTLIYREGFLSRKNLEILEEYCISPISEKWGLVTVPAVSVPESTYEAVDYAFLPMVYGLSDIGAINSSGVAAIRTQPVLGLYGSGIHIVIIDTGINWRHEAFINADQSSRIELLYDQENNISYTKKDISNALRNGGDVPGDENGHGTFIAGIAGGGINLEENFSGVAPNAEFIVVKLKEADSFLKDFYSIKEGEIAFSEADIMSAIAFVEKYAEENGLILSYCIGVGSNLGSHLGTSPLCDLLEDVAEKPGRCVTVASGNQGIERLHFRGQVKENQIPERVEINVDERESGFTCELWSDAPEVFTVEIISPTGQIINRLPARNKTTTRLSFVFENTRIYVFYRLFENRSGKNLVIIRFKNPTSGIWTINVYGSNITTGKFDMWLLNRNFLQEDTNFVSSDPFVTICEPGNTMSVITPAAYDYVNKSIYIRNGRGFTANGFVKPDFAAPGVNMIGPTGFGTNGYEVRSGSSIAAAFVTGLSALIEEYGIIGNQIPYLRTGDVKNILIAGAARMEGVSYPSPIWGYGTVNIYNSIQSMGEEF